MDELHDPVALKSDIEKLITAMMALAESIRTVNARMDAIEQAKPRMDAIEQAKQ